MKVEYADISLLGAREENQDRVTAAVAEHAALLLVVDGMGGHADGARAAEVTQRVVLEGFWHTPQPLFDPLGFLHMTLGRAHEEVVRIGTHLPLEQRPRATCAVCLVQQRSAWWAHVGDSRVYHIRNGALIARTRDHSHVELLLREGLITVEQVQITGCATSLSNSRLGGDAVPCRRWRSRERQLRVSSSKAHMLLVVHRWASGAHCAMLETGGAASRRLKRGQASEGPSGRIG